MCKILVVDDDKAILDFMEEILNRLFDKHEIETTISSQEALEKIEDKKFDIIFFNSLESEDPNGIEFAESCRDSNPFIILIYMSGHMSTKKMFRLAKIGIDTFIEKPIDLDYLKTIVINSLNRHKTLLNGKTEEFKELENSVENMIFRLEKKLNERGGTFKWIAKLKNWMKSLIG